ncbi:hypothetical protein [Pseudodesulfovibrio sp.]|uniref:hypothetical protein n=1 Tax=unclassified Pseudodesulfovibrio TaxID=2661612 RepID=UPI003B0061B9
MAWVEIDGHRLLAQLQSAPQEGAWLVFIVRQIVPNIVLQELRESALDATSAPKLDYAASFEAARTLCENHLRPYSDEINSTSYDQRAKAFVAHLRSDGKLRAAYLDTLSCGSTISDHFAAHTLLYQPWLLPKARRQVTIIPKPRKKVESGLNSCMVEFDMNPYGLVRIEFLNKDMETGYRIKLQHISQKESLRSFLESSIRSNSGSVRCLGISKLSPQEHGGVLAELLFTR